MKVYQNYLEKEKLKQKGFRNNYLQKRHVLKKLDKKCQMNSMFWSKHWRKCNKNDIIILIDSIIDTVIPLEGLNFEYYQLIFYEHINLNQISQTASNLWISHKLKRCRDKI